MQTLVAFLLGAAVVGTVDSGLLRKGAGAWYGVPLMQTLR